MSVMLARVLDVDGNTYEVKTTKNGNVMLCGEWVCTEMSIEKYTQGVFSGRFTVVRSY